MQNQSNTGDCILMNTFNHSGIEVPDSNRQPDTGCRLPVHRILGLPDMGRELRANYIMLQN